MAIESLPSSCDGDWELVHVSSQTPDVPSWSLGGILTSYISKPPDHATLSPSSITVISEQEAWFEENKTDLQKELEAFFPDKLTLDNVLEFVKLMNEHYPKYHINPKEDLLQQIHDRKQQMIQRGEQGLMNTLVGTYALAFVENASSIRELLQTTLNYCAQSDRYSDPLTYDQTMLRWFAEFEG